MLGAGQKAGSNRSDPRRRVALCYGRKSVVRTDVDLISIENQRQRIQAEAERRGLVVEWYEDVDKSGRREDHRPGWLALKQRIGDPDVAAVIVYRLDRAARSVRDVASLVELCQKHGVAFITADGVVDTTNGVGALLAANIGIFAVFAQFESDIARERMREYCANKDRAGVRHGRVPFGTKREGSGYDARFVPNDDAPAVVRCLNLYASGLTYDNAAARLNAEGVPLRRRDGRPKRWGCETLMARMDAGRLAALQARIEDAKRKLSTLADLYLDKRISRADYERKFAEFSAELRAAEAELAQPVEVERAMQMLGDLGGMLGQMTPEAQKRNLHRIFTRIELNDQGEAVRVEVKPWVMRAFEPMLGSTPVYRTYYAEGGSQP